MSDTLMEAIEEKLDKLDKQIRSYESQIESIRLHKVKAEAQYTALADMIKEGKA